MRKKKRNKLIRYLKVSGKKLGKLNRKKVSLWLNKNFKEHPFILGILAFIWFTYIVRLLFDNQSVGELVKLHLKFHGLLFVSWFVLVVLSNSLRDKQKTKWYFKKRFIFITLIFFTPLGLILLWLGGQFKRVVKIVLTAIFIPLFIANTVYQEKKQHAFINMSPLESIVEMITKQKSKVFLKNYPLTALANFKFVRIPEKERVKLAVSDIYARCSPSIVSIKTKDKSGKDIGMGSGFIVSKEGIIVTNFHVIESAYQAEVMIADKLFKEVYLVKGIPSLDIAVLKIYAQGLSPLAIGDSDNLLSGQIIVTLGNPLGLEHSISSGIISSIRSSYNIKLIQMTAPVSMGSSGGPVLNEYGEVIGITTLASFFMAQNLNFAVPINYLEGIINQK